MSRGPRPGSSATATSAADPLMKPSRTTGIRASGGLRDDPDEDRDLEPADRGEHPDRIGRVRPMARQRRLDDADLAPPARLVDARPVAGHRVHRGAGEDRRQRARRRRVADPHLADPEQVETRRIAPRPATTRRPVAIACERLVAGHRRPLGHVGRPARTRALTSVPPRTGSGATSGIGPATPASTTTTRAPTCAGEHVDGRSTADEVGDHLGGDLGRVGRDAAARDAVIGGGHDDRTGGDGRVGTPGDARPAGSPAPRGGRGSRVASSAGPGARSRRPSRPRRAARRAARSDRSVASASLGSGHDPRPPLSVSGSPATSRYASSAIAASRWWVMPTRSR